MSSTSVTPNGKVALITGADSGIGRVTASELALAGYHVFLAGLHAELMQGLVDELAEQTGGTAQVDWLALDLGDLQSVRRCADEFLTRDLPLHLLINNAGVVGRRGMTASGFEMTFGVCYVGHFLLTELLLDKLVASAPARIINVASKVYRDVKRIDFDAVRRPNRSWFGLKQYSVAKLANVLHTRELAHRHEGGGITTCALHPGTVSTNIWQNLPAPLVRFVKRDMLDARQGAATTLHCATAPDSDVPSGSYFEKCRVKAIKGLGLDMKLAGELYERTQRWLVEAR